MVIAPASDPAFVARINGNNCNKYADQLKSLKAGDVLIFDRITATNADGFEVKLAPVYYKLTK